MLYSLIVMHRDVQHCNNHSIQLYNLYTCAAYSSEPPQMIISPSQSPHIVKVGTQLLLYCAAEGLPIPTVQWHGDGVPVHPLEELYQQIFLVPTDSPHTTVYVCIGRNQVKGVDYVDQANVIVVVEGKKHKHTQPIFKILVNYGGFHYRTAMSNNKASKKWFCDSR